VAEKLGLRYLDEEIIGRAAAKGGVSPADVADAARRKSVLNRVLEQLGSGLGVEAAGLAGYGPARGEGTEEQLRGLVVEVVEEAAARGDVVIAAHGASFALANRSDVLRVHVTASPATRSRRVAVASGLEPKQAAKEIRSSDASRADYLRRFYDVEAELPTQYDLVLNTDGLTLEEAAEIVVRAAG
jgi:hypothetical protein